MKPRLFIDQKITAFVNKYSVYVADGAGAKSGLVALAQQKRLAFKEKVLFYNDEKKTQQVFSFRAEKVLDIHGRFIVEDENGQLIGMFKKDFGQSLAVSTWHILDSNGNPRLIVKESNVFLAVLRRYAGWLPLIGDIVELLVLFLKYHFVFVDATTGQEVGKYSKVTLFRDYYVLELTDEVYTTTDWRVLSSMGVALDALQSR